MVIFKNIAIYRTIVAVAVILFPTIARPGSIQADVACHPAGKYLAYDCTIRLSQAATGAPVTDAAFTVTADMASMPMAHNVRPVTGMASGEPGVYRARLDLEMVGTWTVNLQLSRPTRDRITRTIDFREP